MITKKTKLALATAAVGAALGGTAMNAAAFNAGYAPLAEPAIASNLVGLPTATVANTTTLGINAQVGDLILGRTTGFGINVNLDNATFAGGALAGITSGSALTGTGSGWTINPISVGATVATITFAPSASAQGIAAGAILNLNAGDILITGANGALNGPGGTVTGSVDFFDSVSGTILLSAPVTFFTSAEGTTVAFGASSTPGKLIDVGAAATPGKTDYALLGSINAAAAGDALQTFFHAGSITLGTSGASGAGSAFGTWVNVGGLFQYAAGSVDTTTISLSGDDFSAFTADPAAGESIWIEPTGTAVPACSGGIGGATSVITDGVAGAGQTIGANSASFTVPVTAVTGAAFDVCFAVNGTNTTEIDDQAISANVAINLDPAAATAGGVTDPADSASALAPMVFNGDVVDLNHVNPASNTVRVSKLRISNTGATAGQVTITAVDDNGNAHPGTNVVLQLGAGESISLDATDIENGTTKVTAAGAITGALGDGTGKWRVRVTAEFAGLVVNNTIRGGDGSLSEFTFDSSK